MLWAWRQVQALVCIDIFTICGIIRVDIVGNRMGHINIDATRSINHLDKSSQPNPRVIVDRNTEILRDGKAAQSDTIMVMIRITVIKCLVQFHHTITGYIDKKVTRNGEHPDAFRCRIDGNNDICLRQVAVLKFLICITSQQENIDTSTAQDITVIAAIHVRVVFSFKQRRRLSYNIAYRRGKVSLVIVEAGTTQDNEDGENSHNDARPDGETPLFLAPSIFLAVALRSLNKWQCTTRAIVCHWLPLPSSLLLARHSYRISALEDALVKRSGHR